MGSDVRTGYWYRGGSRHRECQWSPWRLPGKARSHSDPWHVDPLPGATDRSDRPKRLDGRIGGIEPRRACQGHHRRTGRLVLPDHVAPRLSHVVSERQSGNPAIPDTPAEESVTTAADLRQRRKKPLRKRRG